MVFIPSKFRKSSNFIKRKSFAHKYPNIAKEWDYDKNEITPDAVSSSSTLKVWWICSINPCGCHKWQTSITARVSGESGCPFCINRKACDHNSLLAKFPEICKEWDYEMNTIDPNTILPGTKVIFWWVCSLNPCGCHKWKASATSRTREDKCFCPFCSNQRVCKHTSLLAKFPELCKEWDYDKNDITPDQITHGSSYRAWWKCQKAKCDCHSWQTRVSHRTSTVDFSGCPFCNSTNICIHNSLFWNKPELCKEWYYTKNDKLPIEYSVHAREKVYWKCLKNNHVWKATISHRTSKNGSNCPHCKQSQGEKQICIILDSQNIEYIPQKKFDDCVYKKKMPFDFYLIDNNILIEFDGKQHFEQVDYWDNDEEYEIRHIKDNIKNKYCYDNKINLLRISYKQINNMEKIIKDFMNDIKIDTINILFSDKELYENMETELDKHKELKLIE